MPNVTILRFFTFLPIPFHCFVSLYFLYQPLGKAPEGAKLRIYEITLERSIHFQNAPHGIPEHLIIWKSVIGCSFQLYRRTFFLSISSSHLPIRPYIYVPHSMVHAERLRIHLNSAQRNRNNTQFATLLNIITYIIRQLKNMEIAKQKSFHVITYNSNSIILLLIHSYFI